MSFTVNWKLFIDEHHGNTGRIISRTEANGRIYAVLKNPDAVRYPFSTVICTTRGVKVSYYGWPTEQKAAEYVNHQRTKHADLLAEREARKAERKKADTERAAEFAQQLKPGDILIASWGYEAQFYEFYQVQAIKGGFAYVREMTKRRTFEGAKCGSCTEGVVMPGEPTGDTIKKKIQAGYIKIDAVRWHATPWDGQPREEANWH